MKRKINELQTLASNVIGDGQSPNLYFVSVKGVIITVTRDFDVAYREWLALPRDVETCLEDRKIGIICDTSPIEEGSSRLQTWDDSSMVRQYANFQITTAYYNTLGGLKAMYFKDLTKKEKKHLREQGVTTLREMKRTAEAQAEMRKAFPMPKYSEPCWECRSIAQKLGLSV